ncbi:MAG: hypothetical protein HFE31_04565 [Clostridia bacterium]|nr:hypothetical protein [Clostridia bacterium]
MLKQDYGIRVLSATQPISDDESGEFYEMFLEWNDEKYSKRLSKRVRNGLDTSVENGTFCGGFLIYGYKIRKEPIAGKRDKFIKYVEILSQSNQNVVSGIAIGCDSIAHKICIQNNKKTVAFLSSTLQNIYPQVNKNLVDEIAENGGVVITEYVLEAKNKYESINRFIERDRLQVMFVKAVVLIVGSRKGIAEAGTQLQRRRNRVLLKDLLSMIIKLIVKIKCMD